MRIKHVYWLTVFPFKMSDLELPKIDVKEADKLDRRDSDTDIVM